MNTHKLLTFWTPQMRNIYCPFCQIEAAEITEPEEGLTTAARHPAEPQIPGKEAKLWDMLIEAIVLGDFWVPKQLSDLPEFLLLGHLSYGK